MVIINQNLERQLEDAGNVKCDACGHGFALDERMNFEGSTTGSLIHAVFDHLATMLDKMYACECAMKKLIEIHKVGVA